MPSQQGAERQFMCRHPPRDSAPPLMQNAPAKVALDNGSGALTGGRAVGAGSYQAGRAIQHSLYCMPAFGSTAARMRVSGCIQGCYARPACLPLAPACPPLLQPPS